MILHDRASLLASFHTPLNPNYHRTSLAIATKMTFDRVTIVPFLQYQHSQVLSLWELHCFYFAAEIYLRYEKDMLEDKTAYKALRTIKQTLEGYQSHWALAGIPY